MGFETVHTYRNSMIDNDMSEYKKCPHCGEQILAVAKKCKYCREWIVDSPVGPSEDEAVTPNSKVEKVIPNVEQVARVSTSNSSKDEHGKTTKTVGKIVAILAVIIVVGVTVWLFASFLKTGFPKQETLNMWKPWVLSKAKVEDYTPMDLVMQYTDERTESASFVDYIDQYEFWWIENGNYPKAYEDAWVSFDIRLSEMEMERDDFNSYYYPILARLTLINALSSDGEDNEDDITDALAAMYLKMMGTVGDNLLLSSFVEAAEEGMDLDNLRKLSRANLKKSMDEVLEFHGFSIYKIVLSTDDENDQMWWGADNVSRLALDYKDEFFENVMAILGDFSGLEQMIDKTVDVYSCERNSELSSDKADVYDVIYSIMDKMYVKCTILVSDGKSEIKINSKSATLLSL